MDRLTSSPRAGKPARPSSCFATCPAWSRSSTGKMAWWRRCRLQPWVTAMQS